MPRQTPKPFFRAGRGWYVQLGKAQVKLAGGPRVPATEAAAWTKYHEVMVAHAAGHTAPAGPAASPAGPTVAEVCDKFLDWCQRHRAARTYDFYRQHLQDFLTVSEAGRLPARDLKPFHVVEWADSHGTAWSPAARRGAIVAAQRPFNWAVKVGHLPVSPVPHVEKPRAQRRELAVTAADWAAIRASYPAGDPFAELLEFCWETGARPQEAKRLEARHVDLGRMRAVFPAAESKGQRRPRVVHLNRRAAELVARRLAGRPAGVLFVNRAGAAWTAFAMANRFARLKKSLGVKFCGTAFRHGFCQKHLENGTDHLTVAELMGHADGKMVATTYSHMNRADRHLRDALESGSA